MEFIQIQRQIQIQKHLQPYEREILEGAIIKIITQESENVSRT